MMKSLQNWFDNRQSGHLDMSGSSADPHYNVLLSPSFQASFIRVTE